MMAKEAIKRPKPSPDRLRYLGELHVHDAAHAAALGDRKASVAAIKAARARWKRMDIVDTSLANAMGLKCRS